MSWRPPYLPSKASFQAYSLVPRRPEGPVQSRNFLGARCSRTAHGPGLSLSNLLEIKGFVIVVVVACPFCVSTNEDIDHLLASCPFLRPFRAAFLHNPHHLFSVDDILSACSSTFSTWPRIIQNTLILALLWTIWKLRNRRVFDGIILNSRLC